MNHKLLLTWLRISFYTKECDNFITPLTLSGTSLKEALSSLFREFFDRFLEKLFYIF